MALRPLEDRIVVKANEAETTTASGLVIPDTAKEKPQEGTVVAVGPGRFDDGVRAMTNFSFSQHATFSQSSRSKGHDSYGKDAAIRRASSSLNGTRSQHSC
jgi:co-chaperonin GroES (HSP10)